MIDAMKQAEEYLDSIVAVELAVKFAQIEGRKVNQAIRETVKAIAPKISDSKVHAIFIALTKQAFPDGALKMMRRQLDSAVGE